MAVCSPRQRRNFTVPSSHSILLRHAVESGLLIATTVVLFAGCGVTQPLSCLPHEQTVITDTLYFGTAKPGGTVTTLEWESFVNEVVLPAFPQGLTSWAASGRWRMATGIVEQEPSYVLQLTHKRSEQNDAAIQHIMRLYKHAFYQEAVMRVRSQGCRSF